MGRRFSYAYVDLALSRAAYTEIRRKLHEAGYEHAFEDDGRIDMHGIAIVMEPDENGEKEH